MPVLALLKKKSTLSTVLFLFVFGFYLFTRLFLFSKEGSAAFGYDTGIYRHYIQGYFERIHDPSITPFGFSGFSNFMQTLGVNTDEILIGWYLLLTLILFLVFFVFVQTYTDTSTALLAVFLFSISIIQYEFFWWFYYRNFFALVFFFIALILIKHRSYLVILPLIAMGTLHILTLLPIGLMMVLCLFQKEQRKFYFVSGTVALGMIVLLNFKELFSYFESVEQSGARVNTLNPSMPEFSGQFIDGSFFWKHTILYLFFGIIGLVYFFKKYLPLALTLLISCLPIVFGVLFYRRYYIFLDVFLIFFASVFLIDIIRKMRSNWVTFSLGCFLLIAVILNINYVVHKRPLLFQTDLNQIMAIDEIAPASVMAVSSATAPWLYGFTHHKIIAPGIFEENKWSESEWQEFWTTSDKNRRHELLKVYAVPLFVFVGSPERGFESVLREDDHFIQRGPSLWQYLP